MLNLSSRFLNKRLVKPLMIYLNRIPGIILLFLCSINIIGCVSIPSHDKNIRYAETVIGTNREEVEWNFHSVLEYKSDDNEKLNSGILKNSRLINVDFCSVHVNIRESERQENIINLRGIGLQFPGYILGIEKTNRERLGLAEGPLSSCNENVTRTIYEQSFLKAPSFAPIHESSTCFIKRRLDDAQRSFLSHIAVFKHDSSGATQRISGSTLYSVYDRSDLLCTVQRAKANGRPIPFAEGIFRSGYKDGLSALKASIENDLETAKMHGSPYTHLFVYVMGWNTGQSESIDNFNSLFGYLLDASANEEKKFKPLFVGISWPSSWSFGTGVGSRIVRTISFWNKKNDADELGVTWVNYLLNDIFAKIKNNNSPLKIVLIGHSFGARVASRAFHSCDLLEHPESCRDTVDLVIGLQAAFGRSRFGIDYASRWQENIIIHPMHHEGPPFTDFSNFKNFSGQQAYVWSRYDSATSLSAMMGGDNSIERTKERKDVFRHLPDKNLFAENPSTSIKLIDAVNRYEITKEKNVLLLDGSEFVRHNTPYHGGGAHSDIYSREIGKLTWELVKKFAPLH